MTARLNVMALRDTVATVELASDILTQAERALAEKIHARERADLEANADAIRARCKSLHGFIKAAWHTIFGDSVPFVDGWHIDELCAHLEAITYGKMRAAGLPNRLINNIPPGTMKSLTVSVFWPAWEWAMGFRHFQYITASFRLDACLRDSGRFRRIVTSDWYQRLWDVQIDRINDQLISNHHGGFRQTTPFGSMMGARADRIIIDDPHSIDQTESDADRERSILNFRERVSFSINDPETSAIVITMQRLHERDLTGVILMLKLGYILFRLPMRFEADNACATPFGRDRRHIEDELLWPERLTPEFIEMTEKGMTAHAVAGQHQQRPGPRAGLMFKRHWFKAVPAAPADCQWVRGWDLAGSVKKTSAYTAGVKVGFQRSTRHFYIVHVERDRVLNPETMIVNTAALDGKQVQISLPQDPGSSGLIQARALVAALVGYNVRATREEGEKQDRAIPVKSQAEMGNVSMVEGPWNEAFLDEIVKFPAGAYKDQVDALSRAFGEFILRPGAVAAGPIIVTAPFIIHGTPDTL